MKQRIFAPSVIQQRTQFRLPKGKTYYTMASRETSLARDEAWMSWLVDHGVEGCLDLADGHAYAYYAEERSYFVVMRRLAQSMEKDWAGHLARYRRTARLLHRESKCLSQFAQLGKQKALPQQYARMLQAAYGFSEYIWSPWAVISILEPALLHAIPEHLDDLLSLDRPITYLLFQQELAREHPAVLQQRYGWLKMYNPHDKPYTIAEIQRLKKQTTQKSVAEMQKAMHRARVTYQRAIRQIPRPLRKRAEIVHTYAFLKTDRMDVWRKAMALQTPFYLWLSKQLHISIHAACNLWSTEVTAFLATGKIPSRTKTQLRAGNNATYFLTSGSVFEIYGRREAERLALAVKRGRATKRLRGIAASRGFGHGIVRVVLRPGDIKQLRPGEVLVAKYTFPNYTPAMRKSAAIVTDEGGLTSHAAVVSRELGLPCVVGTGIATQIFHTGDRVEVDANNGIVRKIAK